MKINYPIVVLIFLAVVSVAHASFDVSIISESHDIIEHEAIFLVKNLENVNTDFYISTIINETDSNAYDIKFYEWKAVPTEIPVYSTETITNEYSIYNGTLPDGCIWIIEDVSYSCSFTTTYQDGTQEVDILAWKSCKQNLLTESANSIRSDYDAILIPKSTSKPSYDYYGTSYGADGEKIFRLTWKMPIINYGDRFGSAGYYAFYGNNISYDPWWNISWNSSRAIDVNIISDKADYSIRMNIPYDEDMKADYSDLRFVDETNTTEFGYWIESYNNTNATIWVKGNFNTTNGTQMYMYYGNPTATTDSNYSNAFWFGDNITRANNDDLGYDWFEANLTANITDNRIFWSDTSSGTPYESYIIHDLNFSEDFNLTFTAEINAIPPVADFVDFILMNVPSSAGMWGIQFRDSGYLKMLYSGCAWTCGSTPFIANTNYKFTWLYDVSDNKAKYYVNDVNQTSFVAGYTDGNWDFNSNTVLLAPESPSASFPTVKIGNVSQRKYLPTEPTYSIGDELSGGSSGSIFVNITSPLNNTAVTTSSPTIIFNVTGNETAYSCTAYINSTAVGTNASCSNATNTTITSNISVSNGIYNITVNCSADWGSNLSGYHNISVNNSWLSFGSTGQNATYINNGWIINLFSTINSSSDVSLFTFETNETGTWQNKSNHKYGTAMTSDYNLDNVSGHLCSAGIESGNCSAMVDMDFSTYGQSDGVSGNEDVYLNYSLSDIFSNSTVNFTGQFKVTGSLVGTSSVVACYGTTWSYIGSAIGYNPTPTNYTFNVPSECLATDILQLRIKVSDGTGFCTGGCLNISFYEGMLDVYDAFNMTGQSQNISVVWINDTLSTLYANVSWRFNATNSGGSFNTTNGSFIIDGTNPTILNVTVPYGGGIVYGGAEQLSNFTANVSDDASGLSAVYCEVDGSNHTASNISDIWYCELRGLTPDTYQISFWAVDNVGNINHSDNSSYIVVYSDTYGVGDSGGGGGGGGAWYMPPTTTIMSGNQTGTVMPEIPITARIETIFILGSIIFFLIYRMQKKKSKRIKTI